ncbi:hypothetical protein [Ensifer adhaerens]|uniref:hypothetical protein n=1 Tax=Ensifer adhaerens TaxID=106592 RepID=UPI001569E31E|nr:hypothetical protein [Ensifer adhaerens]
MSLSTGLNDAWEIADRHTIKLGGICRSTAQDLGRVMAGGTQSGRDDHPKTMFGGSRAHRYHRSGSRNERQL